MFGQYSLSPAAGSKGSLQITSRILDLKKIKQGRQLSETGALEDLGRARNTSGLAGRGCVCSQSAPTEEAFRKSRRGPSRRRDRKLRPRPARRVS